MREELNKLFEPQELDQLNQRVKELEGQQRGAAGGVEIRARFVPLL